MPETENRARSVFEEGRRTSPQIRSALQIRNAFRISGVNEV
jgi:hypothetical protein